MNNAELKELKNELKEIQSEIKTLELCIKRAPKAEDYKNWIERANKLREDSETTIKRIEERQAEETETTEESEYEKQANDFLTKNDLKLTMKFKSYGKYFPEDKEERNIYIFKIYNKKTKKSYTAQFGDSIHNTEQGNEPTNYSILSCLNEDYSENFEDFCRNYGYDEDSRSAEKIYKAVQKETAGLRRVLNEDQLNELNSIN